MHPFSGHHAPLLGAACSPSASYVADKGGRLLPLSISSVRRKGGSLHRFACLFGFSTAANFAALSS
jgi:hypothetical protein